MRKLLIVFLVLAGLMYLQGRRIDFDSPQYSPKLEILEESSTGIEVGLSVKGFDITSLEVDGKNYDKIESDLSFLPGEAGKPDLPHISKYIALPQGAQASVKIIDYSSQTFTGISAAPAPEIPLETEDGLNYFFDDNTYRSNEFYPNTEILLGENDLIRGVDCVPLAIFPFRYNPVTQELIVITNIRIQVEFHGGNGHFGEDRLRSRWWDPINNSLFVNSSSLPEVDYNRQTRDRYPDYEYLIITPDNDDFIAWADTIAAFRNKQGIRSGVVTITEIGGNNQTMIENYINDAYNDWDIPPVAFLLLGDYGPSGTTITSPMWSNYCVSDNIYADVNNNDMADMAHARITARNAGELETMINKALDYEINPPTNPDFYNNPVSAGGWQTERWFIICSEAVYGFWANELGKEPVREYAIYSGTPGTTWSTATNTPTIINYFGQNGLGYLPATPNEITDWGANATRVNQDINNGCFVIQHRDHGGEDGWGEPSYSNNNLNSLENEDLTFVFSINCLTGKYNIGGECFTEAFHRHSQGALGLIAASEVSYSFVNDTYTWGMYDYMWPNFMPDYGEEGEDMLLPCFANPAGKYFLQQSDWPYNTDNKEVTYHLFHHHGDAFTRLYSEVPEDLTIMHDPVLVSGASFFTVSADEGALICLSIDNEILAVETATGAPQTIAIEPQMPMNTMDIVITKQNYYRYDTSVLVIPPDGAYIIYNDVTVDDEAANGNGQADYGETVLLDFTFENIGNDEGIDVEATISCVDDFVTITEAVSNVGMVPGDTLWLTEDAFELEISDDIPDQHEVLFTLEATDQSGEFWTSYFMMTFNAPLLYASGYMIDDTENGDGDGIFDAGETVEFVITNENFGHSFSPESQGLAVCSSTDITLLNDTYDIGIIEPNNPLTSSFTVTADSAMHVGTQITINYTIVADNYTIMRDFRTSIGITCEDFESGDFSSFDWELEGNEVFTITNDEVFEGDNAAKTGDIWDNQSSSLVIDIDFLSDANLSFYKKVSSEAGCDFLSLYIDGELIDQWSGEIDWSEEAYYVRYGHHVIEWIYEKDGGTSMGDDCAWLDYIIFPPVGEPASPVLMVDPLSIDLSCAPGETIEADVNLSNIGGGTILYAVATENPASRDVSACYVENSTTIFEPGETTDWEFTVYNYSSDHEWIEGVDIQFPEGVVLNEADDFVIASDRIMAWNEETGNGALSEWYGITPSGYGVLRHNEQVSAEVNVSVSESFTGVMEISYTIYGDGYGEDPHTFADTLEMTYPLSWIGLDLQEGSLNSNEVDPVHISIDASELELGEHYCDIVVSSDDIYSDVHIPVTLTVEMTASPQNEVPAFTGLTGCYPNPFNPTTNISYQLAEDSSVELEIYNIKGQHVKTLVNSNQQTGEYQITWNGDNNLGSNVSSGVYFYRLKTDTTDQTCKMLLLK